MINIEGNLKKHINYIVFLILITFFHVTVLDFLKIQDISPDLFTILAVWITLKEGAQTGLIYAFFIGLYFDIIFVDIIGTNALAKTATAFTSSFFYKEGNEHKITKNYKFILVVLLATFIHNLIYYFFYIRTSEQNFIVFYLKYGIASTLYTAFFASLLFLIQIPSNRIKIDK